MGMSRSGHVSDSSPPSISYQQTYSIIGAAMKVHRVLGCGFLEAVYRAALLAELQVRGVPCQAEVLYQIAFAHCNTVAWFWGSDNVALRRPVAR
jgi:hypothetical protein